MAAWPAAPDSGRSMKRTMYHLEAWIAEHLEWQGYLVRRSTKVGRLKHGGWEMELDVIAFHR